MSGTTMIRLSVTVDAALSDRHQCLDPGRQEGRGSCPGPVKGAGRGRPRSGLLADSLGTPGGVKDGRQFKALDERLSSVTHVPLAEGAWRLAADIGWQLARKGEAVPLADLIIAAAAIEANLTLWTVDSDFERVAGVASLSLDLFGSGRLTPAG